MLQILLRHVEQVKSRDLGSIYLMSNIGITAAVFFLPLLLKLRGISDLNIGILAIPYSFALFISNSTFGRLTDIHGRKPFLLLGLFSSAVTTLSYLLPETLIGFGIARFINGISLGTFPAAIIAIASDRQTPMGELSAWRALGWTLGGLLNGVLADIFQLEAAFIFGGGLFFCAFLFALWRDTGGKVDSTKQKELQQDRPKPNYGQVLRHNWQIYLTVILRHGSGASIWIYWTLFLQVDLGLTNSQIGVVLAINTLTQTVVMKYFTDRGDPRMMLVLGTFLSALSFFSFPLTRNFIEISLTQVLLGVSFAFFLVGGLRSAETRGTQLGMVGTATGLFEASFSVSQLVGPVLAIVIFSQFATYTSIMNIAGGITLVASLLYLALSQKKPLDIQDND